MPVTLIGRRDLDRALRRLAAEYPKEAARGLNRTSQRVRTQVRRGVASHNGVAQKLLRDRVKTYKATARRLTAKVWIGIQRKITLAEMPGARFTARGLKAGRHSARAFRVRLRNGHEALMVRLPNSSHYKGGELRVRPDGQTTELPIDEPAIRLDRAHADRLLVSESREHMVKFFPKEFRRLIAVTNKRRQARR